MQSITVDPELVGYCGLYCGACGKYLNGKCRGCHDNVKATWCKVWSFAPTVRHASSRSEGSACRATRRRWPLSEDPR